MQGEDLSQLSDDEIIEMIAKRARESIEFRRARKRRNFWIGFAVASAAVIGFAFFGAHAQEPIKSGAWAGSPAYVIDWLNTQRSPTGASCCGLGDAINVNVLGRGENGMTQLEVTNPRGRGELTIGQIIEAPDNVNVSVNYDEDAQAVAWVSYGGKTVYCLSQPSGV